MEVALDAKCHKCKFAQSAESTPYETLYTQMLGINKREVALLSPVSTAWPYSYEPFEMLTSKVRIRPFSSTLLARSILIYFIPITFEVLLALLLPLSCSYWGYWWAQQWLWYFSFLNKIWLKLTEPSGSVIAILKLPNSNELMQTGVAPTVLLKEQYYWTINQIVRREKVRCCFLIGQKLGLIHSAVKWTVI